MKLNPPAITVSLLAVAFVWMAWEPDRCPQWDGVEHPGPNGVPHYRGPNLDKP